MNKLISLICLLLLTELSSAQLITNNSYESKGFDYDEILKLDNGLIYAKYSKSLFKKGTFTLTALDENLGLVNALTKELVSSKKEAHHLDFVSFAGGLYQISVDGTPTQIVSTIQELDQKSLELKGSPKTLIDLKIDAKSASASLWFDVSENGEFLAIKDYHGKIHIFNDQFSEVTNYDVKLYVNSLFNTTSLLTNDGYMYFLYCNNRLSTKPSIADAKRFIIKQFDPQGNAEEVTLEHTDFLLDPVMKVDANGHLFIAGSLGEITKESFWADGNIDNLVMMKVGCFFIEMDVDLREISTTYTNFESDLVVDGLKPNLVKKAERAMEKGKKLGYQYLDLSKLIPTTDGFYLIGEDYVNETKYDPQTRKSITTIYHGSILILKLDKQGNLVSYNKVFKSQYFNDEGGFSAYLNLDKLYLIFNDDKANVDVQNMQDVRESTYVSQLRPYVVEISENGMSKYLLSGEVWKNKQLVPAKTRLINNMLFIYGITGGKGAFGAMKVE